VLKSLFFTTILVVASCLSGFRIYFFVIVLCGAKASWGVIGYFSPGEMGRKLNNMEILLYLIYA